MLFALLSLFGYDRRLVARLSHAECQRLGTIAVGWLVSLLMIAIPMGYSLWLVEHSLPLAFVTALSTFALTLNLLRVATAGGGLQTGSTAAQVRDYRPGLAPAVFVGLLGLIFAQPAQLPLNSARLDPLIAEHRAHLVAEHRARVQATPPDEVRSFDAYRAELASCEFVVRRMALLWQEPARAARFSALYCLVILLPAFFSQYVAVGAVRRYQRLRYRQAARLVQAERVTLAAAVDATLSAFPGYRDAQAVRSLDARPLTAPSALLRGQLSLRRRMPG